MVNWPNSKRKVKNYKGVKKLQNEQRLKEIKKELIKINLIETIPMIMIGLGLYAKFGKVDELIFEFLTNDSIVNGMFIVSVPVVLWCIYRTLKLALEQKNLGNIDKK